MHSHILPHTGFYWVDDFSKTLSIISSREAMEICHCPFPEYPQSINRKTYKSIRSSLTTLLKKMVYF